jgi:hypothetical protein
MAHFAKIIDNTVTQVIVINNDDCGGGVFPESELIGQTFIASLGIAGEWLQTSYNNNFRNVYASGKIFNASLGEYGEFVPPVE